MKTDLKIGVRVKSKGTAEGLVGTVTRIVLGESTEQHGTIEIIVEENNKPNFWSWVKVGDLEHFCYHEWDKELDVL